jgi:hydrogenase maturation protease
MDDTETRLVIGIGNPDRGDDGAGIAAARLLAAAAIPGVRVMEHSGEAAGLIELWQTTPACVVYMIDALVSGAPSGTIKRFAAHLQPLPAGLSGGSTHLLGIAQAVELARVLECLPSQLIVFGIEGTRFDFQSSLSEAVAAAVQRVAAQVQSEVLEPEATQ